MSSLERTHNVNGTSYMGEIHTTYANLVNVFGEPHYRESDGKVDAEWNFVHRNDEGGETVFTIYNWKNGPTYTGFGCVEDITTWHVGGYSRIAARLVYSLLVRNAVSSPTPDALVA